MVCCSIWNYALSTITSFLPALLAQLILNTTATHTITYTNWGEGCSYNQTVLRSTLLIKHYFHTKT